VVVLIAAAAAAAAAAVVVVVVAVVQIQSPVADYIDHNTDRTNFDLRAQILQVIKIYGPAVGSRS